MELGAAFRPPAAIGRARIAVIGAGLIGQRHIQLIGRSPRSTVAGIADPDPSAGTIAKDAGVPWFPTLEDLLAADRPDGAIIATPNAMHVPQALACIGEGVPVLVEKPIATTVDDGMRLADAAERRGVPLLVGHHRRHSPLLAAARAVIEEGHLGRLVAVLATTLFAKPAEYFEAAAWRREPGGGPILINLIHDVDALRMLIGDVVSVRAIASSVVRGYPVEDTVAVAMEFADGAVGSVLLSDAAASPLSWETTAGEDPAFPRYDDRDCYVVAGTRGTLGIPTLRLTASDEAPSWRERMPTSTLRVGLADPLARQLEHFCDVVAGRATPAVSGRDAAESLRVTLAVAEAARTERAVACAPAVGGSRDRQP